MRAIMKKITQLGGLTYDCDATVMRLVQDFGIGPWLVYEFSPENNSNLTLWEKPENTISMRLAVTNIGKVEIEYIEPTSEKSIYQEQLAEKGESMHHIAFDVEDYGDVIKYVRSRGYKNAMSGIWLNGKDWAYLDTTKDLKFIGEIYQISEDFGYPKPQEYLPSSYDVLATYYPVVVDFIKAGMVVNDIYKTIRTYSEGYGHYGWSITRFDNKNMEDTMVDGKKVSYSYLSAVMEVEDFKFELIQPLDGPSVFKKYLDTWGEGICSLGFVFSKDYDMTIEALAEKGYRVVQSEKRQGKRTAFIDATEAFKAIIEITE